VMALTGLRGADGVEALGAIAPGLTLFLWWGTGQGPPGAHLGGEELSRRDRCFPCKAGPSKCSAFQVFGPLPSGLALPPLTVEISASARPRPARDGQLEAEILRIER
jgi:hypothetical protein